MSTVFGILAVVCLVIATVLLYVAVRNSSRKAEQVRNEAIQNMHRFTSEYAKNRNAGGKVLQYPTRLGVEMAKKEDKKKNTKTTKRGSSYSGDSGSYGYSDYGSYDSSSSSDSGSSSSSSDSGSSGGGCE